MGPKISHSCLLGTQDLNKDISTPHQPDLPQSSPIGLSLCTPKPGPSLQPDLIHLVISPKGLL